MLPWMMKAKAVSQKVFFLSYIVTDVDNNWIMTVP